MRTLKYSMIALLLTILPVVDSIREIYWVVDNNPDYFIMDPYETKSFLLKIYHSSTMKRVVTVQAHTQYEQLTISLSEDYSYSNSYNGSDVGLLVEISPKAKGLYFNVTSKVGVKIPMQVMARVFEPHSPIPGGCCLTCDLDNDPNLVLTYNDYSTTITFGKANVYEGSSCDSSMYPPEFRLKYSLYRLYIAEQSLQVSDMLETLKLMYDTKSVKENAEKVGSLTTGKPQLTVDSEQGQGVVYTLIVEDPQHGSSALYTSALTYACNFTAKVDSCDAIGSPSNIAIAVLMILVGLFLTVGGHKYFSITIFIGGVILYSCVFFIVFVNGTDLTHAARLWLSVFMGSLSGGFIYLIWCIFGVTMFHVFHTGLMFGVLVASSIFFIPAFEELSFWDSDVSFTVFFVAVVLVITSSGLIFIKVFHVLCTSAVGSYGVISGIDYFMRSSLRFIVFNMIRRAVGHGLYLPPFETRDFVLLSVWILLLICGFIIQWQMAKGKPNFPKSQNYYKKWAQRKRLNRQLEDEHRRENMPILINYHGNRYGSTDPETNIVC